MEIDHDPNESMHPDRRIAKIEDAIDKPRASAVTISGEFGGVQFNSMGEVMEFAKLMAVAEGAVPRHLRGSPGACLAVVVQAVEWKMSPFAVANKSYFVNDRIAFESQLIHAIIEARAPLERRLKERYIGEGPTRQCIVSGIMRGEDEPREVTSPMVKDIKVKNSPLWTSDPDQQLFYYTSRAWARRICPDVILGVYTPDELPAREYPDLTEKKPSLVDRLQAKTIDGEPVVHTEGFQAGHVDREVPKKGGSDEPTVEEVAAHADRQAAEHADDAALRELDERKAAKKQAEADDAALQEKARAHAKAESDAGKEAKLKAALKEDLKKSAGEEQGSDKKEEPVPQTQKDTATAPATPRRRAATPSGDPVDTWAAVKTGADYIAYARAWFPTMPDATAAQERWKSEKKLRAGKLTGAELEGLIDELDRTDFKGA